MFPALFEFAFYKPALSFIRMDTQACVQQLNCPMLIAHSKDDPVIPFRLAQNLYQHAKNHNREIAFFEFDGYGHNCLYKSTKFAAVTRWSFWEKRLTKQFGAFCSCRHFISRCCESEVEWDDELTEMNWQKRKPTVAETDLCSFLSQLCALLAMKSMSVIQAE